MNKKLKSKSLKKNRLAIRYSNETAEHIKILGKIWGEWSQGEIVARALKECAAKYSRD